MATFKCDIRARIYDTGTSVINIGQCVKYSEKENIKTVTQHYIDELSPQTPVNGLAKKFGHLFKKEK